LIGYDANVEYSTWIKKCFLELFQLFLNRKDVGKSSRASGVPTSQHMTAHTKP